MDLTLGQDQDFARDKLLGRVVRNTAQPKMKVVFEMRRRTFDTLVSLTGMLLVAVLIVAGALLTWGHYYINDQVHNQLAQQQIYFPPKAAFANPKAGTEITPSMIPSVSQYSGQQLLTGTQAGVYANDFIAVHLYNMPYHGVYSAISTAVRAATPGSSQAKSLAVLEQTSFQGTTLRGMLLNAYAFGTVASIMGWAAIGAFIAAAILAILSILGLYHARKTDPVIELLS